MIFLIPEQYEYRTEIIEALGELLNYCLEKYSKFIAIRFDITFPKNFDENITNYYISTCISYVVKKYSRQGYSPSYMWVREQDTSIHPHYHCLLVLDAQKVRSFHHVFETVENAWGRAIGMPADGLIHNCTCPKDQDYNGKIVRRDAGSEALRARAQEVFNQCSYMAKDRYKPIGKDGIRNFGMSQIRNRRKKKNKKLHS